MKYVDTCAMSNKEIVLSLVLLATLAVSVPAVMVFGNGIDNEETTPMGGIPFADSLQTIIGGLTGFLVLIKYDSNAGITKVSPQ